MNETQKKQVAMHKDFFDKYKAAFENEFYLEAIFLDYAAIESRLEVILGVLGAPCNKNLPPKNRSKMKISDRRECLKKIYKKNAELLGKSKLNDEFFNNLKVWIKTRNQYIHGLYKNEIEYDNRNNKAKEQADAGLKICKVLYSEAKRLRKMVKEQPDIFRDISTCSKKCEAVKYVNGETK